MRLGYFNRTHYLWFSMKHLLSEKLSQSQINSFSLGGIIHLSYLGIYYGRLGHPTAYYRRRDYVLEIPKRLAMISQSHVSESSNE